MKVSNVCEDRKTSLSERALAVIGLVLMAVQEGQEDLLERLEEIANDHFDELEE